METASVTDMYQASYYLLSGCEILGVDCIPTGKALNCQITLSGADLTDLAQAWYDKKAIANLWAFRNAYSQINSHVQQAKRSFETSRSSNGGQK